MVFSIRELVVKVRGPAEPGEPGELRERAGARKYRRWPFDIDDRMPSSKKVGHDLERVVESRVS